MLLKDDDLVIRNATVNDVQILCKWWSDGKVMAHAGFPNGVYTDPMKLAEQIENESDLSRRLIIKIETNKVGEMNYRIKDNTAEIGIKICDFSYQEKGYGTKALKLLIGFLFAEMKVQKIILDTNVNNLRAQHVYEKIGFIKTSVSLNSWRDQLGELQSFVNYELKISDYEF
jgi:RimJ/RimL family protein N-acetyltransferase